MIFFYDVPVYRLPEDNYYKDRDAYVEASMFPNPGLREFYASNQDQAVHMQDHLQRRFGGCWQFNEIIGYIRLHFLGTQIRGEYFASNAKKIVRTRNKQFECKTWKLAPETEIPISASNPEIWRLIQDYLGACQRLLPNRTVDTSVIDTIGLHVDWRKLLS